MVAALVSSLALLTNPDLGQHREALRLRMRQTLEEQMKERYPQGFSNKATVHLAGMFGDAILAQLLENSVHRQNWGLFSFTRFSLNGKLHRVGFGMFGRIWISSSFDDALRKEMSLLRGVEVGDLPMDAFALPTTEASDSTGL